jgi:transposase
MSGPKAFSHTVVSTRRSWAAWEKRAIVDEAQQATSSISAVARRHGITPSLLFRWRRELLQQDHTVERPPAPAFVPLVLPAPADTPHLPPASGGVVEVEWAGGRVRIAGPIDRDTVVAVLGIVVGRR